MWSWAAVGPSWSPCEAASSSSIGSGIRGRATRAAGFDSSSCSRSATGAHAALSPRRPTATITQPCAPPASPSPTAPASQRTGEEVKEMGEGHRALASQRLGSGDPATRRWGSGEQARQGRGGGAQGRRLGVIKFKTKVFSEEKKYMPSWLVTHGSQRSDTSSIRLYTQLRSLYNT